MPIPEFQAVMLRLHEALADGREHTMNDNHNSGQDKQ